ncbi:MAG TPA: HlyD family secretion protein [Dongiaceae bacterium]|nr:HlyD family secretion protein [Dongiaceae bacterium]
MTELSETEASARPAGRTPSARILTAVRALWLKALVILLAAALVLFFAFRWNWIVSSGRYQSTDDAYIQADVVPIIAKIPGYVRSTPVEDFSVVALGTVLAEIEDDDYSAHVQQAEAAVDSAEAALDVIGNQIQVQQSLIDQAAAQIDATEADLARDRAEALRQQTLLHEGLAGNSQRVEQATAAQRHSEASVRLYNAQLRQQTTQLEVLKSQEAEAKAAVAGKIAALTLAQISLSETKLVAPRAGVVSRRLVNAGAYVSTGTQLMTLVPLADVYVIANFKETQITNMAVGQVADISVDTFPDVKIEGTVEAFSPASGSQFSLLPPDNATGNFTKVVQRIPVKIRLKLPQQLVGRLLPGSSVIARIDTGSAAAVGTGNGASIH